MRGNIHPNNYIHYRPAIEYAITIPALATILAAFFKSFCFCFGMINVFFVNIEYENDVSL